MLNVASPFWPELGVQSLIQCLEGRAINSKALSDSFISTDIIDLHMWQ
jgi:hypothetical protein